MALSPTLPNIMGEKPPVELATARTPFLSIATAPMVSQKASLYETSSKFQRDSISDPFQSGDSLLNFPFFINCFTTLCLSSARCETWEKGSKPFLLANAVAPSPDNAICGVSITARATKIGFLTFFIVMTIPIFPFESITEASISIVFPSRRNTEPLPALNLPSSSRIRAASTTASNELLPASRSWKADSHAALQPSENCEEEPAPPWAKTP